MFEAHPELKDEKVRTETEATIQQYAAKFGYSANDVDRIEDSRLMRLLISASKADGAKVTAKAKQENKIPVSKSLSIFFID